MGESNAIAFWDNSVLGARTQHDGDFVDIAAAVVGRAPFAGLHTDEGRFGEVLIDVTGLPARPSGATRSSRSSATLSDSGAAAEFRSSED